ncbi:hypothetical protein GCM10020331_095140 [Ectobacillus funiculus]
MNKPVAVISASPHSSGGDKAHESIMLTLQMVEAKKYQKKAHYKLLM